MNLLYGVLDQLGVPYRGGDTKEEFVGKEADEEEPVENCDADDADCPGLRNSNIVFIIFSSCSRANLLSSFNMLITSFVESC